MKNKLIAIQTKVSICKTVTDFFAPKLLTKLYNNVEIKNVKIQIHLHIKFKALQEIFFKFQLIL